MTSWQKFCFWIRNAHYYSQLYGIWELALIWSKSPKFWTVGKNNQMDHRGTPRISAPALGFMWTQIKQTNKRKKYGRVVMNMATFILKKPWGSNNMKNAVLRWLCGLWEGELLNEQKREEKNLYGHAVLTDSCVAYVYLELCYISWPLFRDGGRSENPKEGEGGN